MEKIYNPKTCQTLKIAETEELAFRFGKVVRKYNALLIASRKGAFALYARICYYPNEAKEAINKFVWIASYKTRKEADNHFKQALEGNLYNV